jgi:hypothetical protein
MKRLLYVFLLGILIVSPIIAQEGSTSRTRLKVIGLLGKGIAVSPDDPLDFKMVQAGVARAIVATDAEEKEFNVGLFVMDNVKYRLKNVVIEEGKITADIHSVTDNTVSDDPVGSLELTSFVNEDMRMEVWAGKLDLEGNFNLYMVEAPRPLKALELRDRVKEYCEENPEDQRCQRTRDEYCKNNPDDERCQELFRDYCEDNMEDARCRYALNKYCNENPDNERCQRFVVRRVKKFCEENPDNPRCVKVKVKIKNFEIIAQRVETRIKERREAVAAKVSNRPSLINTNSVGE